VVHRQKMVPMFSCMNQMEPRHKGGIYLIDF
jgi:hypothetical protein